MGAKVSVRRSETMFNITWHLCQTVCHPLPSVYTGLSGFCTLGTFFCVDFQTELSDLLSVNQKTWMKFDLSIFFLMWWHEKPWKVMLSVLSLVRPVCFPSWAPVSCRRPWDGLEAGGREPYCISCLWPWRRAAGLQPSVGSSPETSEEVNETSARQTDTLEKASESSDYGSWFWGCLLPCGDVGRWPPFTLWTSGFDLHLHPSLSPWSLLKHSCSA